jgi:hypothetical protein
MTNSDEVTELQVEAWKTTIGVQQHFNDIEMKIRALAITLLTAVLGVAALAIRDGTKLHVGGADVNLSAAILIIGFLSWLLLYFVDELWYHRLLMGSVRQGRALEELLEEQGVKGFALTKAVGDASPFTMNLYFRKLEVHSTAKIRVFYFAIAILLAVAAGFLWASTVNPSTSNLPLKGTSTSSTRTT